MQTQDLTGAWRLTQAGQAKHIPAAVPGCVHLDLLAAGKIEDPYFRDNENRLQWIGQTDWVYSRDFDVPADLRKNRRVLLRCLGLDTLATIRINGKPAGKADNMYRSWEFDVKRFLRPGTNRIEITFAAAANAGRRALAASPKTHWGVGGDGRQFLRKEPCNFGWDWGPILVTAGIWRDIELAAFSTARLTDLRIDQDHSRRNRVTLKVQAAAEVVAAAPLTAHFTVTWKGKPVAEARKRLPAGGSARAQLEVRDPRLWWPNNLGDQPLYEVTVDLVDAAGGVVDTITRRIGLRTLRLVRKPDPWGQSFHFAVNGVPFFAKGANWIPADTFAPRLTRDDYARLLKASADANMNMLRVWGGGIYEDDAFYDLADELGICLWHDFMFSCSTYPTYDDTFMANVAAEAADNIRRIRHHPAVALWCGNNELEQGFAADQWTHRTMSWKDYGKLFDKLLPDLVRKLDGQRDYWPCSPHSPLGDRKNFNNPTCGDAHLWDVWHGRKPFEWYRTCEHRFNSEFGFQSFPEPKTVRSYTVPADRNITSFVMEHHQRSGIGNTVIMQYMLDWFRLPSDFDQTLWLSQILHGMAMKYAVEHWRRSMPRGMGTLYWQLNDCWPVASWASIDSIGRWKALHYMARKFNNPLLVSGLEDAAKGTVDIHVTSDLRQATSGRMDWLLTDVAGKPIAAAGKRVAIPALKSSRVERLDLSDPVKVYGQRNLMLWLDLTVGGKKVSTNFVTFARPKHLELQDPKIAVAVKPLPAGAFAVTLTARRPALWTWLELSNADAKLSDNFFHLRPGEPVTVEAAPAKAMTVGQFKKALRVRSLVDTYK